MKLSISNETYEVSEEQLNKIKEILGNQEGVWEPEMEEDYYFVDGAGIIIFDGWENNRQDNGRVSMNNIFRTPEEAENHKLRLQSMRKTWLPEQGEKYWTVDYGGELFQDIWRGYLVGWLKYHTGLLFRTEKEAEEWIKKYKEVWMKP